jgi:hypothetical protein
MNDTTFLMPTEIITVVGFAALVFGVCGLVARAVGLGWVENSQLGRFGRLNAWLGGILSAVGIIFSYHIMLGLVLYYAKPGIINLGHKLMMSHQGFVIAWYAIVAAFVMLAVIGGIRTTIAIVLCNIAARSFEDIFQPLE